VITEWKVFVTAVFYEFIDAFNSPCIWPFAKKSAVILFHFYM